VPSLPEGSLRGGLAHASSYGMLRELDRSSSRESSVLAGHQFLEPGGSNRSGRNGIAAALALKAKQRAVVHSGSTDSLSELVRTALCLPSPDPAPIPSNNCLTPRHPNRSPALTPLPSHTSLTEARQSESPSIPI
jgi:hypothetical protein